MATGPKWSRGALEAIDNMYVVRNNLLYEYYPIEVKDFTSKDKFLKLEISPGIMSPGVAVIEGNFYDVSLEDLFRRRINVARRHVQLDSSREQYSEPKTKKIREAKADTEQQGSVKLFGDEIGTAADMAWQDQIDSLLETFSSEEGEEFEITGST